MAFSAKQIRLLQRTRNRIAILRDDERWRLLLLNCGIRIDPERGVPSLKHPQNSQLAFESVMARMSAYPESELGEAYWLDKSTASKRRLLWAIHTFDQDCQRAGLIDDEALPNFVYRQTKNDEGYDGGTYNIDECDVGTIIAIAEGFKAWMRREAKRKGVRCPAFSTGRMERRSWYGFTATDAEVDRAIDHACVALDCDKNDVFVSRSSPRMNMRGPIEARSKHATTYRHFVWYIVCMMEPTMSPAMLAERCGYSRSAVRQGASMVYQIIPGTVLNILRHRYSMAQSGGESIMVPLPDMTGIERKYSRERAAFYRRRNA